MRNSSLKRVAKR